MASTSEQFYDDGLRRPTTRYIADVHTGLSTEQVNEYLENGWDNRPVDPPSRSTAEIIKANVFTYFNFIFFFFAVLLIIVGAFKDLTFMLIILLNTMIGIVQEIYAKRTLEKMSMLDAKKAKVVRNGRHYSIEPERLVLDDIVIFEPGNQICADAVLLEGEVQVNESLLTGEQDEITKVPGDHLLSGSFIVNGKCHARLEKVGADSYISKLTLEAKANTKRTEQSEMIRSLNRLLIVIGIIIIPIGITLFCQQFVIAKASLYDSITSMVAAVIGMIPEGLFLMASIALALSVIRLAGKKVLVHDMKCIESLARVNVLCVDKTGTITESVMQVDRMVTLPAYDPEKMEPLNEIVSDFAAAMSKDNETMAAMQRFFKTPGGMRPNSITPFSSAYKYSSAVFTNNSYVLGAPEFVLRGDYEDYREEIEEYSSDGFRVLVFGIYDGIPTGKELTGRVTPLSLILLKNPIRESAPETFRYFESQDVEIKVISGDNPITVSKIAQQAGITGAENYIDASLLKTREDIANAVTNFTVFGRVTPNQKRIFVQELKKAGNTVAMTGDGVNDVLALKDADCSVAMASGSQAACQASQLVLLESDFSTMPNVVLEGRQVVNNLERSASLFLVKNIFSLLMSLFSILFAISYPLTPSQITLISMFNIGLPGFLLSQVPNSKRIKGHFITNVLIRALPAGITDAVIVGALLVFGDTFNVNSVDISTASTILLCIVGFMILYEISKPMDRYRWMIFGVSVGGLIFCLIFLRNMFSISGMSIRCIMLFVVFSALTEPLLRYLTRLTKFLRKTYLKFRHRESEIDELS